MCIATFLMCNKYTHIRAYRIDRCDMAVKGTALPRTEIVPVTLLTYVRRQGNCGDVPIIGIPVEIAYPDSSASPDGTYSCPYICH
ncbi:hypothetical protein SAMD00023353_0403040 [Rosellinia necatrix]|uniref:Uncharacterized protein n=1 Tax=Rosellinia necatrix TaxID=77044 RepID=A0A1S7UJ70_ROSNE|nr:hypothetical protein SAMD00023353_0403040 [Rosellinia necatrix]